MLNPQPPSERPAGRTPLFGMPPRRTVARVRTSPAAPNPDDHLSESAVLEVRLAALLAAQAAPPETIQVGACGFDTGWVELGALVGMELGGETIFLRITDRRTSDIRKVFVAGETRNLWTLYEAGTPTAEMVGGEEAPVEFEIQAQMMAEIGRRARVEPTPVFRLADVEAGIRGWLVEVAGVGSPLAWSADLARQATLRESQLEAHPDLVLAALTDNLYDLGEGLWATDEAMEGLLEIGVDEAAEVLRMAREALRPDTD